MCHNRFAVSFAWLRSQYLFAVLVNFCLTTDGRRKTWNSQ